VLLALLVILPLSSWFYLQRGLDYRLETLEQLASKAALPNDWFHNQPGTIQVLYDESVSLSSRLEPIKKHFEERQDIQFIPTDYNSVTGLQDSLKKVVRLTISDSQPVLQDMLFLINQKGSLVMAYRIGEDSELALLTKHVVFLMPPEEEKDFEFRREREK